MADDLDDEWWLNDKSDKSVINTDSHSEDKEPEVEEKPAKSHKKTKKRKAEDIVIEHEGQQAKDEEDAPHKRKKKKKKKKKNLTQALAEQGPTPPIPDSLISAIKQHFDGKLSTVEWDELQIKEDQFGLCNDLSHTAISFLKTCLPKWKKLIKGMDQKPGSPVLLIITSSAIRAAQLNREIAVFKGEECKVAKLFAKHMKVNEQVAFLQRHVIHIGVGTPNRMCALLDQGSLKLNQLNRVVIDWTWRDVKQRRLMDMPEVKEDLFQLLYKHILSHTRKGNCKLALL